MVNLGLSRKKMMGKVDDLLSELSSRHHVQFKSDVRVPFVISFTIRDEKTMHVAGVSIGISELARILNLSNVSRDMMFLNVVANSYHEAEHVKQYTKIFSEDRSENALVMSLSDSATWKNPYYYRRALSSEWGTHTAYYSNVCEIDAEKHGVMGLYEYLCREFPYMDAEIATLEYIKFKTKETEMDYYIPDIDYSSYCDVISAFDEAFEKAKSISVYYFRKPELAMKTDGVMSELKSSDNMYDKFFDKFTDSHPYARVQQDRLVAAVNQELHPEIMLTHNNLDELNLDVNYVLAYPIVKSGLLLEQILVDGEYAAAKQRVQMAETIAHKPLGFDDDFQVGR